MSSSRSFFEQVMFNKFYEADDDPPAEEIPAEPPDVDMPAEGEDPGAEMDMGMDMGGTENEEGEEELEISDKISLAMNANLYQRYLTLLNTVNQEISSIKNVNDIIYTVAPRSLETLQPLNKLAENLNLYLAHNFLDNNYSKNLLFYNKCLNLLKLLTQVFSQELKKGNTEEQ